MGNYTGFCKISSLTVKFLVDVVIGQGNASFFFFKPYDKYP